MSGTLSERSSRSRQAQYDNGVVDERRWSGLASSSSGARRKEFKSLPISEMRVLLQELHIDECMSDQELIKAAIRAVEEDGIVFLDEIDKICASHERPGHNADASDEGVQRDLLPLLEGTTINTKQGDVNTDHILFIASGAFHAVKPSDLLAELQGRLPVRVELKALSEEDLYRILTATENNLLKQQQELLQVDGVTVTFTDAAVREIARVAHQINLTVENIGARRLHTVVERIVEQVSFQAPDLARGTKIIIDENTVRNKVTDLLKIQDLSKFIL